MCSWRFPVVSALADDPERFLERNAKLQWGIMVCIYGMSHVPALLLLDFRNYQGKNAFLVFFLVLVVQTCMVVQHFGRGGSSARPARPTSAAASTGAAGCVGVGVASLLGGCWPASRRSSPARRFAMAFIACVAGSLGHLVMKALKRDRGVPSWGKGRMSVTGANGLLDRVDALCFAAPVFFHSVRWYFQPVGPGHCVIEFGIDPGLRPPASACSTCEGHAPAYVASGTISTRHLPTGDLPARLKVLFDGICEVVQRYQPDAAAVEIVFVNVNPQATLLLGRRAAPASRRWCPATCRWPNTPRCR
jgi:hypothetical protein